MKYHNNNFMVEWSPQHEELYVSVVELGELITYAYQKTQ